MGYSGFLLAIVSMHATQLFFMNMRLSDLERSVRHLKTEMKPDLTPKVAKQIYGGDGGAYYAWSPNDLPVLRRGNIGAAKLALEKNGFALPRFSDSAKVAYVLQGSGVAGIVLPEKDEKVVPIKQGDAVALPFGAVTWYYNKNDTDLVILFLGDTSKAHKSGSFTDFFPTDLGETTKNRIVKLNHSNKMPEPKIEDNYNGTAFNCEEGPLDVDMKNGVKVVVLNSKNLPLVDEIGLGADLVRLAGRAVYSPGFSSYSALQVTYIVRGSGSVRIVGVDGKRFLEKTIKAGDLLIVPKFYVVSKIANPEGMDWFSIITTPNPVFGHLGSVWKGLSPEVMEAGFNAPAKVEDKRKC